MLTNKHSSKRPPLYRSFAHALSGIGSALLRERNLRIHTAVAAGVFCFAPRFSLARGEWAVLVLTIALVLTAELINSALENLTDLTTTQPHPLAKAAKDIAAGAVFIAALGSVGVGICLFWHPATLADIWRDFLSNPLPFLLGIAAAVAWVMVPNRLHPKEP